MTAEQILRKHCPDSDNFHQTNRERILAAMTEYAQLQVRTIANETGLTPRQLLEQRNELLEALQSIENDDGSIPGLIWRMAQSAIQKATGEKS